MGWDGLEDQTLVKELCLLRLPEVFLRHCPCFPPLFGRSDGQIIGGEEMFGPQEAHPANFAKQPYNQKCYYNTTKSTTWSLTQMTT